MKSAVHSTNNTIGFFSGMFGGLLQYHFTPLSMQFIFKILEAGTTAFVCGLAGLLGKQVFVFVKRKIKCK